MRLPRRLHVSDDLSLRAMSARSSRPRQLETLPGMESAGTIATVRGHADALTDEQEQAVARRAESLIVSAAAGSGKTSVLVERFVRAVREDGIAPGRILAITFTERAAGELRERVRTRLLGLGERQAARDTEAAFIGTFHGFCARLLRAQPLAAGLDPDFTVIEEGLAGRLRDDAFRVALQAFLAAGRETAVDLLAAYGVDRVRAMVEQVFLELRSQGQRLPRLPRAAVPPDADALDLEAAAACLLLDELLERFSAAYERNKRARAACDFDDLELLALELLERHEDVRASWSERFELLMVDEFQDTNPRQLGILRALDRENLFTVGDEFQSIYGFRHADVSLFRARRDELRARNASLSLTRNFRSREPLLDVVNGVFGERFAGFIPLRAGRVEREPGSDSSSSSVADGEATLGRLRSPSGGGEKLGFEQEPTVELLLTSAAGWERDESLIEEIAASLPPAPLWRQAEAWMLAQRAAELVRSRRARAGEIVVLLRASGDLEVFERALQLCGLRTLAAVGAFWGHQQIGDLISYLRALANPLDEEALYGLLASPLGRCSRDCLALIAQAAQTSRESVWLTVRRACDGEGGLSQRLTPGDLAALGEARDLLERERTRVSRQTIASSIERAIEASGYRAHVLALEWGERRLANVHKLLRLARRFEASEGRDLRAFLDHIEYLEQAAAIEPDAPVDGVDPDAVRLMTAHAAKGLEFPVVFLADLGRMPNSRTPDLLLDGERVGLRLMRLDGQSSSPALAYDELCAERRAREAAEEDRVFYVAMTRARELLILSGSVDFERWPRPGPSATPISWLVPALAPEMPQLLAAGQATFDDLALGPDGSARVRCRVNSPGTPLPSETAGVEAGEVESASAAPALSAPPAIVADPPLTVIHGDRDAARERERERMATLSYSSLTELERCGYRYYLERVLRLKEDRAAARSAAGERGLEARARGTLVHSLMETLDFASPRVPSPAAVGDRARALGLRVAPAERDELARLVERAVRGALAARVAAAVTVRREHPFALSLGPHEPLITGVIDLLAVEAGGEQLVLDYKSDRVAVETELERLVEHEYSVQRLLYALAVLREGAVAVEIVHWFLEREDSVSVRYTAAERPALEAQLAARITLARARGFAVSPLPHRGLCLTCPGRGGLCSWGEQETLRELPSDEPSSA
jgi:ATP-dependent helicase/nuclease subunit A